jgi:chromate transporter
MAGTETKRRLLKQIFFVFFCIGPTTFGGGYAMIPVLEKEIATKRKWIGENELADILAAAQTIPGAVGVNAASLIGYRLAGIPGAIAAMLGISLPTFLIIAGLGGVLFTHRDNPVIHSALEGIRPAVVAMIVYAGIRVAKSALSDVTTIAVAVAAGLLLLFGIVTPLAAIVIGLLFGVIVALTGRRFGLPAAGRRMFRRNADERHIDRGEGI